MGFTQYLKRVVFRDANGNGYVIPVSNLSVWYEPWHSTGKTIVRYFHGANAQRIQGYQGYCEFDMEFGHQGVDDATLSSFLNAVTTNTVMTVDFDPDIDAGNKTMTVILDDVRGGVGAGFSSKIRGRSVKLRFIDPLIRATIPAFVSGASTGFDWSDGEDLILYTPDGLTFDVTGEFLYWVNEGSIGASADQTVLFPYADILPRDCEVDPDFGNVFGVDWVYPSITTVQATWNGSIDLDATINDSNADTEVWMIFKSDGYGGAYVSFWTGLGGPTGAQFHTNETTGEVYVTYGLTNICASPAGFNDGDWHVLRVISQLSTNTVVMHVDGYLHDSGSTAAALGAATDGISIGAYGSAGLQQTSRLAVFKVYSGSLGQGRTREIYAHLRDTLNLPGIPADGTATLMLFGNPAYGDLYGRSIWTGASLNNYDNQSSSVGLANQTRLDDTNELLYYNEAGILGRVKRCGYGGDNIEYVTTLNPGGGRACSLALNLAQQELYMTHGSGQKGDRMSKRSMDPADTAVAWVEIIATGSYEMWRTADYDPTNDRILFIDSLAATPSLRQINTDGTGDTKIADLTAGKVYRWMTLDPDANVVYFSNNTDFTIEKYDMDTDTHTTAWHTPASGDVTGIDVKLGKVFYIDGNGHEGWEVDQSTPGSRTKLGDLASSGQDRGLSVVVFDTTV